MAAPQCGPGCLGWSPQAPRSTQASFAPSAQVGVHAFFFWRAAYMGRPRVHANDKARYAARHNAMADAYNVALGANEDLGKQRGSPPAGLVGTVLGRCPRVVPGCLLQVGSPFVSPAGAGGRERGAAGTSPQSGPSGLQLQKAGAGRQTDRQADNPSKTDKQHTKQNRTKLGRVVCLSVCLCFHRSQSQDGSTRRRRRRRKKEEERRRRRRRSRRSLHGRAEARSTSQAALVRQRRSGFAVCGNWPFLYTVNPYRRWRAPLGDQHRRGSWPLPLRCWSPYQRGGREQAQGLSVSTFVVTVS